MSTSFQRQQQQQERPHVVVVVAKIPSKGLLSLTCSWILLLVLLSCSRIDAVLPDHDIHTYIIMTGVSKSRLIPSLGEDDTLSVAEGLLLDT
jgi:hypothetical protein